MTKHTKPKPAPLEQISHSPNLPSPPKYLHEDAKWKWHDVWPRLDHRYFSFERDQDVLILYCNAYAIWRRANDKLESMGELVGNEEGNHIVANPYVAMRKTAEERMSDLAAQLRLRPDGPSLVISPWDEVVTLLGGDDDDGE